MRRAQGIKRRLFTFSGLFALAAASLTAAGAVAAAAAGGGAVDTRAVAVASAVPPPSVTYTSQYACDLSRYGYTGPPVAMTGTIELDTLKDPGPTTVAATTGFAALFYGDGKYVNFRTSAVALPAPVASQLANASGVMLTATVPARAAAAPAVSLAGSYTHVSGFPMTQLQGDADGPLFVSQPGTAWLEAPARSVVFTPYDGATPLPPVTCTTTATSATPVKITVTGRRSKAPVYGCASTYRVSFYKSPLPMTVTVAGTRSVRHTVTVTLASPDTGLGAPAPYVATEVKFTGSLPVTGAQPGRVVLRETTTKGLSSPTATFTVPGLLRLTKRGTDRIGFPRRFVYTVVIGSRKPVPVYTCTLAGGAPAALTIKVSG
jgi:hypothetical protein